MSNSTGEFNTDISDHRIPLKKQEFWVQFWYIPVTPLQLTFITVSSTLHWLLFSPQCFILYIL